MTLGSAMCSQMGVIWYMGHTQSLADAGGISVQARLKETMPDELRS